MSYPSPPGGSYPPPPPGYPPGAPPPGYPPVGQPPGYPPGYAPPGYPPQGAPYAYGPPPKPLAPRVLGILSICLGAVSAFVSGMVTFAGIAATNQAHSRKGPEDAPLIAMFAVLTLWSLMLIAVGVGQTRYRKWSLSATWVWAVSGILVAVACVVGFVAVVPDREAGLGFALLTALLLPYPVVMMALFARTSVTDSLE